MNTDPKLDAFLAATEYTLPKDMKKLKFIHDAVQRHVEHSGKSLADLRILEVACGRGGITFPLASLGCQVKAFDIDEEAVEYVRDRAIRENVQNLTVVTDSAYTYDDGTIYDIVVASEVFEHVKEPDRLALSIARRMEPGSTLVLTTPNGYGPYEIKNRLDPYNYLIKWNPVRRLFGKPTYHKWSGSDHCQYYTRGRLLSVLSAHSVHMAGFGKSNSVLAMFGRLSKRCMPVARLDTAIADILPYWLASGWYFVFEMGGTEGYDAQ